MGTIVVAIIVGAFSGLLGSVLAPIVRYHLRQQERKEKREREIHAELRHMLEGRLHDCDSAVAGAVGVYMDLRVGFEPLKAYNRSTANRLERARNEPRHRWEPYRITDELLRALAEQLGESLSDFDSHLLSVTTMGFEEWWDETYKKSAALEELRRRIRLRLDELRW